MNEVLEGIRWIHITAGSIGLAAFWVPVFTHKGGKRHRLFGKIFKYSAYVVLMGAMLSVLLHTVIALSAGEGPRQDSGDFGFLMFLGYLAVVTFIILRHGVSVLENKDLARMNTSMNRLVAKLAILASFALIAYTLYFNPPIKVILFALSPIGVLVGAGILRAIGGKRPERKAWFYEHMGAMLSTGVAFHSAFAVFGFGRLFDLGLTGFVAVVPWVLPTLIGVPALVIWTRHYQRKFGDAA